MAVSVITLAEPFFLKVLGLLDQEAPDTRQLHKLQRQLMADLQAMEQKVNSGQAGIPSGEWLTVKRVLVYWADEVLTGHIRDWDDYTLEQEYFGEKNRAWKFYVEGEQAVPTASSEVAELFYLAIVLGFVGDIEDAFKEELRVDMPGGHHDEATARRYWATQLQRRIHHESAGAIQGEPLEGDVEPLSSTAFWKAGLAAMLISVLLFIVMLAATLNRRNPEDQSRPQSQRAAPEHRENTATHLA
ncbi:MAG: DotU family type IV/VI secretion system protein [Planctomycetaceae bacterium]